MTMTDFRLTLISTGGTIEKTYQTRSGELLNETSVLDHMLAQLELPELSIDRIRLMNKDSLDMGAEDHVLIAETAQEAAARCDGVVVVHGTDRLAESGEATYGRGPEWRSIGARDCRAVARNDGKTTFPS